MKKMMAMLVLIMCVSGAMHAGTKKGNGSLSKEETTIVSWVERKLQGYDMRVWLSNKMAMGEQAWDAGTGPQIPVAPHFGLEYPTGSGIEHLFGAGPRIGGIVRGKILVSEGYNGGTADNEFFPDYNHLPRWHFWHTHTVDDQHPLDYDAEGWSGYYYNNGIKTNTRGYDDDHDGKIDEDDLDGIDNDGDWNPATDDVGTDGLPDSLEVSCDGQKYDPVLNPDPAQDNYDPSIRDKCHPNVTTGVFPLKKDPDTYTEKNGKPDHGEPHVDEDYGAISDNDLYCSATDVFSNPTLAGHSPMGVQIIQKSYAWENVGGVLPFEYDFININAKDAISNVYVGFFADMDVGPSTRNQSFYQNNLAGYIDSLRTAYIYNPVDVGSTPLGVTILKTPKPLDSLTYIFHWFANANDEPSEIQDSACYAWLSGASFAPEYIEQNQTQISDTRFFFSFGPFDTMQPGDTLKIELALVSGYSVDVFNNQNPSMVQRAQYALLFHGNGYHLPFQPVSPTVKLTPGFKKVDIDWGAAAGPGAIDPINIWDDSSKLAGTFSDTSWRLKHPPCDFPHKCVNGKLPGCRNFLGYRLYRYEDHRTTDQSTPPPKSDFTLLRQWDDADSTVPFSPDFPTYHTGIQSTFTDTNLVRGRHYWYAVTSYILPDFQVNQLKNIFGETFYDTVRTPILESNIVPYDIYIPFSQSTKLGQVLAVPNPYRVDQNYTPNNGGWETGSGGLPWTEQNRLIRFIHLPPKCTIRIFDLVGAEIGTIQFDARTAKDPSGNSDPNSGSVDWPIFSSSNRALASGVYIFTVESDYGTQVGKFVLIR